MHNIHPPKVDKVAMKRYLANTSVSVVVSLPGGVSRRISFTPLTGTGSVFYTDSAILQHALESHYRYGSLFRIDPFFRPIHLMHPHHTNGGGCHEIKAKADVAPIESEHNPPDNKEDKSDGKKRMKFTDYESAKDFLCERFNFSRTKLRSQKSIIDAAESKNIELIIQ